MTIDLAFSICDGDSLTRYPESTSKRNIFASSNVVNRMFWEVLLKVVSVEEVLVGRAFLGTVLVEGVLVGTLGWGSLGWGSLGLGSLSWGSREWGSLDWASLSRWTSPD